MDVHEGVIIAGVVKSQPIFVHDWFEGDSTTVLLESCIIPGKPWDQLVACAPDDTRPRTERTLIYQTSTAKWAALHLTPNTVVRLKLNPNIRPDHEIIYVDTWAQHVW